MGNEALIERLLEDAERYWGCVPVGVSQRQREAAAELMSAEAERDEFAKALSNAQDWSRRWRIRCETAEADLAAARAENDRLRGGLRPFAKLAEEVFRPFEDGTPANAHKEDDRAIWGYNSAEITYGDFRTARALLAGKVSDHG